MVKYKPPYEVTQLILIRVANISEKITKLSTTNLDKKPYLRRQIKINSIYASLAIENNKLKEKQVKDVIDGKIVLGPPKDIQEVKNAYNAYEMLQKTNPYSIKDLKKIDGIMIHLIVSRSGHFRIANEVVFDEKIKMLFIH